MSDPSQSHMNALSRVSCGHSMVPVCAELATTNYSYSHLKARTVECYKVSLIFEWLGLSPFLATPLSWAPVFDPFLHAVH